MRLLTHTSILAKFLGVIALLVALTAGVAGLLGSRMKEVDADYSHMLKTDVEIVVAALTARGDIQNFGRQMNNLLLIENPPEEVDGIEKALTDLAQRVETSAAAIAGIGSDEARAIAASLRADMKRVVAVSAKAIAIKREAGPDHNAAARAAWGAADGRPTVVALYDRLDKDSHAIVARIDKHSDELSAETDLNLTEALIIALVGTLATAALSVFIARTGLAKPIGGMTEVMRRLADNDFSVQVPGVERGDEVGHMAQSVLVFKEKLEENRRLEAAAKDAESRAAEQRRKDMNKLADDFDSSVKVIVNAVSSAATQMQTSSQQLASVAEQTHRQSASVAAAAEQASANVQTVAAATGELSASIGEIGRQVEVSSKVAGGAVDEARRVSTMVTHLSEAAARIGDVVKLINDIASQTNLLALNATIEAARAGEAGKGFAVVASEVKSLANQTAKATEEIGQQIASVQGATKEAVEAIGAITHTIGQINEITGSIAAAVEEQSAATQEIARNVQQAAVGTQEVTSNIVGVNQASTETGSAAGQVLEAARELSVQAEHLHADVDRFVATVRAA